MACTYAALILYDDGHQVSAEKISKVLKASGVSCESYWPGLFERALKTKSLDDLVLAVGSASAAPATAAPASGASTSAPAPAKVAEKAPSSDDGGGMALDLFGDDGF